ncbi:MAG: hypothetical protein FWF47_04800 [Clostridia bacterium]|nr:hypothetical protein [Clostridia bacterium]
MDVLEEYRNKFNEAPPLFWLRSMNGVEIESVLRKCIDNGEPYKPNDEGPEVDY